MDKQTITSLMQRLIAETDQHITKAQQARADHFAQRKSMMGQVIPKDKFDEFMANDPVIILNDEAIAVYEKKKKAILTAMQYLAAGKNLGIKWLLKNAVPVGPNQWNIMWSQEIDPRGGPRFQITVKNVHCLQHPTWEAADIFGNVPPDVIRYYMVNRSVTWLQVRTPFIMPHEVFAGPVPGNINEVYFHAPPEDVKAMIDGLREEADQVDVSQQPLLLKMASQ